MQKHILSIKTVLNSMISTLLLLTLLMGFIIVEKNTRKIGFADNNPWFICKDSRTDGHYIKIRFLDKSYTFDFSALYDVTDAISDSTLHCVDWVKNIAKHM